MFEIQFDHFVSFCCETDTNIYRTAYSSAHDACILELFDISRPYNLCIIHDSKADMK